MVRRMLSVNALPEGARAAIPELTGPDARGGLLMPWDEQAGAEGWKSNLAEMGRSAHSGFTLPRDAYEGKVDPSTDEGLGRVMDMAGLAMTGGLGGVPAAAGEAVLGSTAATRLSNLKGLYEPTTQLKPERLIDWQALEGKVMIPMQGDRTQAGQRLLGTEQDGMFQSPLNLQGGRNFARAEASQGPDAAGWASTNAGAKPLYSRTQRVADETGMEPVWAYMPMGPKSSDFTQLGYDTYEQLLRARGGEAAMPAIAKGMPFEPTIDAMRTWFKGLNGTQRSTAFKKKLETQGRMEASGVDPDEVRQLIRDPELEDAELGSIGYGFVKPTGRLITDAAVPHQDYSLQLGGEYMGRFADNAITPRHMAFPDAFADGSLAAMKTQEVEQTFKTRLPYQKMTPEVVDRLMRLQQQYQGR